MVSSDGPGFKKSWSGGFRYFSGLYMLYYSKSSHGVENGTNEMPIYSIEPNRTIARTALCESALCESALCEDLL